MSQMRGTYPPSAVVTVFRSRRLGEDDEEYGETAARMESLARSMPGFLEFSRFRSDDGEHLSFIVFESRETHDAWKHHTEHRDAQHRGRQSFYESYDIVVGDVTSHTVFTRDGR